MSQRPFRNSVDSWADGLGESVEKNPNGVDQHAPGAKLEEGITVLFEAGDAKCPVA